MTEREEALVVSYLAADISVRFMADLLPNPAHIKATQEKVFQALLVNFDAGDQEKIRKLQARLST